MRIAKLSLIHQIAILKPNYLTKQIDCKSIILNSIKYKKIYIQKNLYFRFIGVVNEKKLYVKVVGMNRKKLITIPNLLGYYRILMFPVLLAFAFTERETLFAVFLVINLLTDVADGFIARKFNMETDFGARLDSMADNLTYVAAFTGIYMFKLEEFLPHITSFLIYIGLLILAMMFSLIKFGRFPSLHLYSWKTGGYIQGAFFIILFSYRFITPFYYFMITWGIISAIEHITIQMIIPQMRSNARGLYWVLKEKKRPIK